MSEHSHRISHLPTCAWPGCDKNAISGTVHMEAHFWLSSSFAPDTPPLEGDAGEGTPVLRWFGHQPFSAPNRGFCTKHASESPENYQAFVHLLIDFLKAQLAKPSTTLSTQRREDGPQGAAPT